MIQWFNRLFRLRLYYSLKYILEGTLGALNQEEEEEKRHCSLYTYSSSTER